VGEEGEDLPAAKLRSVVLRVMERELLEPSEVGFDGSLAESF